MEQARLELSASQMGLKACATSPGLISFILKTLRTADCQEQRPRTDSLNKSPRRDAIQISGLRTCVSKAGSASNRLARRGNAQLPAAPPPRFRDATSPRRALFDASVTRLPEAGCLTMAMAAEQWVLVEMVQALYEVRPSPEPPVSPRPGPSDLRPGSAVLPAPGTGARGTEPRPYSRRTPASSPWEGC